MSKEKTKSESGNGKTAPNAERDARHDPRDAGATTTLNTNSSQLSEANPGPWMDYLASNPGKRAEFDSLVTKMAEAIGELRPRTRAMYSEMVDVAEAGRRIGILVCELEEMFAGKRLTEDFWRQIQPRFVDSCGQKISRETLLYLGRMARRFPDPLNADEPASIAAACQLLLPATGDERFQLETERAPQTRHLEPDPLSVLSDRFRFTELKEQWQALRSNPNYFPNGHLRPDLRDRLRVEWEKTFQVLEEFKRELEL